MIKAHSPLLLERMDKARQFLWHTPCTVQDLRHEHGWSDHQAKTVLQALRSAGEAYRTNELGSGVQGQPRQKRWKFTEDGYARYKLARIADGLEAF